MATPSPGYSITVRMEVPSSARATGDLVAAVTGAGGSVTALDVAESHADRLVVDVTCDASDVDHADVITEALNRVEVRGSARSATAPSCCTWAARSRSCRRCRSSTVMTSRVPTHRAWRGCAWLSRRTRRTLVVSPSNATRSQW